MELGASKEPGIRGQEVSKVGECGDPGLEDKEMSGSRSEGWPDNGHRLYCLDIY